MLMLCDCLADQVENLTVHRAPVEFCKAFQLFMRFCVNA